MHPRSHAIGLLRRALALLHDGRRHEAYALVEQQAARQAAERELAISRLERASSDLKVTVG